MINELTLYIELKYFPVQPTDEYMASLPITVRRQLYMEIHFSGNTAVTKTEISDEIINNSLIRIIRNPRRMPAYRPTVDQINNILRILLIDYYSNKDLYVQ